MLKDACTQAVVSHISCQSYLKTVAVTCSSCMHTLSGHTSRAEQSVMSQLAVLLRNAHAIAKAGRPFTDMEWMCALDEKKGLDVGALYSTDKHSSTILQKSSGWAATKASVKQLLPIMVDGKTDSSVSDVEIISIRYTSTLLAQILLLAYIHRQAVKGVISVHFPAYVNGTADHILNATVLALEKGLQMTKQTTFTKLVGFGSDGASVMTGCKSGVSTRPSEERTTTVVHTALHGTSTGTPHGVQGNTLLEQIVLCSPLQSCYLPFIISTIPAH